jgi:hypothetical protein
MEQEEVAMQIMAFALTEERLRIVEHNRAYYRENFSTPAYEYLMELTSQLDFLHEQWLRAERYKFGRTTEEIAWADECRLVHDHVALMHEQVSQNWWRLSIFDYNVGHGMSVAEATERMTW